MMQSRDRIKRKNNKKPECSLLKEERLLPAQIMPGFTLVCCGLVTTYLYVCWAYGVAVMRSRFVNGTCVERPSEQVEQENGWGIVACVF